MSTTMELPIEQKERLGKALARIEDPDLWCQNTIRDGRARCMAAAVLEANGAAVPDGPREFPRTFWADFGAREGVSADVRALGAASGIASITPGEEWSHGDLCLFNNTHTHEQVTALFRKAIG